MEETLDQRIKAAVLDWAVATYRTPEIVVGAAARAGSMGGEDQLIDDDHADRYLVVYAVRIVGRWLVAEIWLRGQEILSINDLGEGLPLEDIGWPWAVDDTTR